MGYEGREMWGGEGRDKPSPYNDEASVTFVCCRGWVYPCLPSPLPSDSTALYYITFEKPLNY